MVGLEREEKFQGKKRSFTVEGIQQTAPARVGGVKGVAGVVHGHDQLGAGGLQG
jgi:hypothetical protein